MTGEPDLQRRLHDADVAAPPPAGAPITIAQLAELAARHRRRAFARAGVAVTVAITAVLALRGTPPAAAIAAAERAAVQVEIARATKLLAAIPPLDPRRQFDLQLALVRGRAAAPPTTPNRAESARGTHR